MLEAAGEIGVRLCWPGWGRVAEQQLGRRSLFWALHSSPGSAAWWSLWDRLSQHELHRLTSSLSRTLLLCLDKSWRPLRLKQDVRAHGARGLLTASIAPAPRQFLIPPSTALCSRSWRGGCCCAHERVADKAKRDVESSPAPLQVVAAQSSGLPCPLLLCLFWLELPSEQAGFFRNFPPALKTHPEQQQEPRGAGASPALCWWWGEHHCPSLCSSRARHVGCAETGAQHSLIDFFFSSLVQRCCFECQTGPIL